MSHYYLLYVGDSVDTLHAPVCEMATCVKSAVLRYCKELIIPCDKDDQYVVMCVRYVYLPRAEGERYYTCSTQSVFDFVRNYKED